jgi:peptidoglycan/LPS O-acetylase OafA/YrhL
VDQIDAIRRNITNNCNGPEKISSSQKNKTMFLRLQSLYMFLSFAILMVLYFLPLWTIDGSVERIQSNPVYLLGVGLVMGITLGNLFNFKKRKLQVVLNRLNIVLLFLLFVAFLVAVFQHPDPAPGLGLVFPLLAIIFLSLANKRIIRDEQLVRSADRLR